MTKQVDTKPTPESVCDGMREILDREMNKLNLSPERRRIEDAAADKMMDEILRAMHMTIPKP